MKPLEGLLVLDFSQFLSGPSASLRMADLGARVVKIERPGGGDICRQLYITDLAMDDDSALFHTINRNKEGLAINLKDPEDLETVKELIKQADVMIQNFRPGVIERLGLGYDVVKELNDKIIYASVTGYGNKGPWMKKPGQDLLAQSLTGLTWLTGNEEDAPTPMGLAVADLYCGAHLVQGILACLVRRGISGKGGRVDVSLMESILDFQFEVLSTHLNDGGKPPKRSSQHNAHAYLGAPYGVYETSDGYLSLAIASTLRLGEILPCPVLMNYDSEEDSFNKRDEIKNLLAETLITNSTEYWLSILEPQDIWCAPVMTWEELRQQEGYKVLDMEQTITTYGGSKMKTLRCPIRVDGEIYKSERGAPSVGEHNEKLVSDFGLKNLIDHSNSCR